jgi:flagellar protein FlbD
VIRLTRFCGDPVFVNSDLIELVERNPDTVLTLTSGNRLTVLETPEQIADLVRSFRYSIRPSFGKDSEC